MTEIMTGQASRVARGLSSVGAGISALASEAGELKYEINGVTETISLFDGATGEMKNTYQVLSEVAQGWEEMSKAEQSALALSLGGKTQIATISAVLQNFNSAIEANQTALDSSGSAMKENERYMESMSAKLNQLKATFQDIILGNGGLDSFGKALLDIANAIATFLKETKGIQVALTALAVVMTAKLIPSLIAFGTSMLSNVATMGKVILSGSSMSVALKAIGSSASTANVGIMALTAVVSIGAMVWNKYKAEQEETIRVAEEAKNKRLETVSTLKDEIATMSMARTSLQNEKLTRSELTYIIDNNLSSYSDEISKIGNLNTARQTAIDKINEEIEVRSNKLRMTGESDYMSAIKEKEVIDGTVEAYERAIEEQKEMIAQAEESSDQYKLLVEFLRELETSLSDTYKRQEENTSIIENYNDALAVLGEKYDVTSGEIVKMTDAEIEAYKAQKELLDSTGVAVGSYEELAESIGMTEDELLYLADALGVTATEMFNMLNSQEELEEAMIDINDAYSESLSNLGGIEDAYRTLAESVNEYNKTGEFSLGTLENLLALGGEYLSLMEYEDGQFTINKVGLENLANARIDEAEAVAYQKAMAELAEIANDDLSTAIDNASQSANDSVTANNKAIEGVESAVNAALQGATAWDTYWSAVSQTVVTTDKNAEAVKAVGDSLNTTLVTLEKARDSIGSYTKEVDKEIKTSNNSTKAKKKSTKASKEKETALDKEIKKIKEHIKALKDESSALKDNISDYEKAISYIIDSTNTKIEQLENKREKALNKILVQAQKIAGTYEKELTGVKAVKAELEERYKSERAEIQATREEKLASYYEEYGEIYNQIEALKKQKEYEATIADFEARKKAVSEYYQSQISALEEQQEQEDKVNTELQRQITLQEKLEALAKAKSQKVKVFKDGQFVYQQNDDTVSSASKDVEETKRQQDLERRAEEREERIASLRQREEEELAKIEQAQKAYEDSFIESYDSQIAKLEEQLAEKERIYSNEINALDTQTKALDAQYKEQKKQLDELDKQYKKTQKTYDDQITSMKKYIKNFEKMVNEYEENQAKLLVKQLTGINTEKANWETRLTNLSSFVAEYNAKLAQLASLDSAISSAESKQDSLEKKKDSGKTSGKVGTGVGTIGGTIKKRATGDASVSEDGFSLIGDDPNKEIVVGSKLNGELLKLSKGDGVINAKSTKTFAGLINSLTSIPSGVGNNSLTQSTANMVQSFSFGDIILPNADGTNFVSQLNSALKSYGIQKLGER